MREVNGSVVIFVDEVDTTLSIPFTDDFYAAVRFIHNARAVKAAFNRLSFVLIGVAAPSDLIEDPKRTPFNIGSHVELTDFTPEEATPFSAGLKLPSELAERVLGWVMKWTGGHPYLTQRLCRAIADAKRDKWLETDVDVVVSDTFFGAHSEQDSNLLFVRDMMTSRAPDTVAVLGIYRDIRREKHPVLDEAASAAASHLKLSGIVRRQGRTLDVRNPIYRSVFDLAWVRSQWPESWAKRHASAISRVGVGMAVLLVFAAFVAYTENTRTREAEALREIAEGAREGAEQAELRATNLEAEALVNAARFARASGDLAAAQEFEAAAESATLRAEELATLGTQRLDALEAANLENSGLREEVATVGRRLDDAQETNSRLEEQVTSLEAQLRDTTTGLERATASLEAEIARYADLEQRYVELENRDTPVPMPPAASRDVPTGDYREPYRNAVLAMNRGQWDQAAALFRSALAWHGTDTGERINIAGFGNIEPYVPHYFLGLSLKNLGDCEGALRAWELSEQDGAVQNTDLFEAFLEGQKECEP